MNNYRNQDHVQRKRKKEKERKKEREKERKKGSKKEALWASWRVDGGGMTSRLRGWWGGGHVSHLTHLLGEIEQRLGSGFGAARAAAAGATPRPARLDPVASAGAGGRLAVQLQLLQRLRAQ